MKDVRKVLKHVTVPPGRKVRLEKYDPSWTSSLKDEATGKAMLQDGVKRLAKQQALLYAQDTYSVLVIFQAMDAAGKDGAIRHVLSGVNPQGCQVFSFKAPSAEERDHTYLWRSMKALPERGRIGIHNRSYYEEVLVARVHKEILSSQQLPDRFKDKDIWKRRFREINEFERYLADNGTVIVKFFLNVSKAEQRRRFLSRIDEEDKNWKFSIADAKERSFWDDYMKAYEDMLEHTSTEHAPWYVVPADNKWFTRLAVSSILWQRMADLELEFPRVTESKRKELQEVRRMLLAEDEVESKG
jgi:PPK2 family polyphosphate:nucleotide phosphotransferase